MKHSSIPFFSVVVLCAAMLFTGCVNKKTYENLRANYDQLQSEYAGLQSLYNDAKVDLAQKSANGSSLEQRLADAQAQNKELKEQLKALQASLDNSINSGSANISKLVDEINASNKYIKQLVEAKSKSDSLNLALQQAHPLTFEERTPGCRREGAEGRGLHLPQRQHALS